MSQSSRKYGVIIGQVIVGRFEHRPEGNGRKGLIEVDVKAASYYYSLHG